MLYRVFPLQPGAAEGAPGGPLFVARDRQGSGRHDNPDLYGALYATRSPESAVAERLQAFRGRSIGDEAFRRADGTRLALVGIDEGALAGVADLDDPTELSARRLRPSHVASRHRKVTQRIAAEAFGGGATGLSWWSVLDSDWINVTLFAERCRSVLSVATEPEPLRGEHPAVTTAAQAIGVALA